MERATRAVAKKRAIQAAGMERASKAAARGRATGAPAMESSKLAASPAAEGRAAARVQRRHLESSKLAATQGLGWCVEGAAREDGGWGGAGTRSQRRPAARFVSRAAARGSIYLDGKRPYRISVQQVLKKAWKRHGYYSSKGFPLGGDSPPMTRQRFALMRKIAAFDDSSSGGAAGDGSSSGGAAGDESSSGGSSSSSSSASSTPSMDFDAG